MTSSPRNDNDVLSADGAQRSEPTVGVQQQCNKQQPDKDEATAERQHERRRIRVLALHGSEGTADSFTQTLQQWSRNKNGDDPSFSNLELQITAIQAPFTKGDGYAWWTMPPGVRSFTAESYQGFEDSAHLVAQALERQQQQEEQGGGAFDLLVGHSQGAILLTALLALGRLDGYSSAVNSAVLLNGVAWPNPFTEQLEEMAVTGHPRRNIMVLVGEQDRINPPAQAARVMAALKQCHNVQVVHHARGHSVPTIDVEPRQAIDAWMRKHVVVLANRDL